uniref:SufB/SufD family protein n=1 Tax=Eubacterium sp. TaxID=142586 RepID=UPI004029A637
KRVTNADLKENAQLVIKEKIMTSGNQFAKTDFTVELNGDNSSAQISSRSVAKGNSKQEFYSALHGNAECSGHSECDSIIMENGFVKSVPEIIANDVNASLIHEAAIGKIAGEQITKLMTLGLSYEEAEAQIVKGFLK